MEERKGTTKHLEAQPLCICSPENLKLIVLSQIDSVNRQGAGGGQSVVRMMQASVKSSQVLTWGIPLLPAKIH